MHVSFPLLRCKLVAGINTESHFPQTWSSRDLSLGLETSRDPFLQVLVSVLVLNLGVLVLVLEPSSLDLGLGLGT